MRYGSAISTPHALAVRVVALGEVEGDHPVVVPDDDVLVDAGQQVERQPVVGVVVARDDRQAEGVELDDQAALGRFGERELRQALAGPRRPAGCG